MARSRSAVTQVRRALYKTQRGLGDVQAAERGPQVLAKRIARRKATRAMFRLFR